MLQDISSEKLILAATAQYGIKVFSEIEDILSTESFTDTKNQLLYNTFSYLLKDIDKFDISSCSSAIKDLGYNKFFNNKDLTYIKDLFSLSIETENIRRFAGKLRRLQIARELQKTLLIANESLSQITGNESIPDILSLVESPIINLESSLSGENNDKPKKLFEDAEEYFIHLEENPVNQVGISTGFPYLDMMIGGGLRRGYIDLLVARPASNKTTLALQIGKFIAEKFGISVLFIDTEMDDLEQKKRSIAADTKIPFNEIETGKFKQSPKKQLIYNRLKEVRNIPLFYKKVSGKPFNEILSIIKRWLLQEVGKDENGNFKPSVIVYDYFKLMSVSDMSNLAEHQAFGFQLSQLTDFLGMYKVACLAFVQANRDGISKETTDIVSQSDRLVWFCSSLSLLRRKTSEEINEEGGTSGNRKIIPMKTRFSNGLNDGEFLNFNVDNFHFTEVGVGSYAK